MVRIIIYRQEIHFNLSFEVGVHRIKSNQWLRALSAYAQRRRSEGATWSFVIVLHSASAEKSTSELA